MKLSIALLNMKPGTAKTTSAVWLAHAFAESGPVLLVDADPSASALDWADLAADDRGGFPFRVIGLPSRELHRRVPDIAAPDDVVIIDAPQIEDHAAIAGSAMRLADEIVVPCAPTPIEINRTTPVRERIEAADSARLIPARSCILLNRCVPRTNSMRDAREALSSLGYDVLRTPIHRSETYAQSFGGALPVTGADPWRAVARELRDRGGIATADDLAWLAAAFRKA